MIYEFNVGDTYDFLDTYMMDSYQGNIVKIATSSEGSQFIVELKNDGGYKFAAANPYFRTKPDKTGMEMYLRATHHGMTIEEVLNNLKKEVTYSVN